MGNLSFVEKNNGYDIFVDGRWTMWVSGSLRTAKKEIERYLRD